MSTRDEWGDLAPRWIARCREGEPNREGMLDRVMHDVIGPVEGLAVVDLGCGEGRFARQLAAAGAASVTGVDFADAMIAEARRLSTSPREVYVSDDMRSLSCLADGSFDLAVSYVTLCDVPELEAALRACARVLRSGGRFVAANLAPMATATNTRIAEPDGTRTAFRVDRYFDEGPRVMRFGDHTVTNDHRTLSTYLNAHIDAGFQLERLVEPSPLPHEIERWPELLNELRAPSFQVVSWRKRS